MHRKIRRFLVDRARELIMMEDGEHIYLSTSCLHDEHRHCRSAVNVEGGPKEPGTCKFCPARCICQCHEKGDDDDEAASAG